MELIVNKRLTVHVDTKLCICNPNCSSYIITFAVTTLLLIVTSNAVNTKQKKMLMVCAIQTFIVHPVFRGWGGGVSKTS